LLRRSRATPRTGTPADLLVVGLGNPGDEFARTRHNVGAEVVEKLAQRHGAKLKKGKERARVDEVRVAGKRVALAIPLTYMNDSGESVGLLARRYGVEPEQVVIVHDELDLPVAVLKLKSGGGLAGHNGLRSIAKQLGTPDFIRLRVGVGRPGRGDPRPLADYVLSNFEPHDDPDRIVAAAADAVERLDAEGLEAAQRSINNR
jgi:peptidyl-tRNA hydrolase, PTH1 family